MKDLRFAKFVLLINGLVPGTILLWDVYHGHAGANPVNYAILTTGLLTLIFLSLTLLVTPLRKVTGLSWLFHFRRTLGLFAFFYALTHFSIFFIFDRALSVHSLLTEMLKRKYLIIGSIGLFSMLPLALTSTNYMIKKMGPKRWQALHRLGLSRRNCRSRAFLHAGQIGHPSTRRFRYRHRNSSDVSSCDISYRAVKKIKAGNEKYSSRSITRRRTLERAITCRENCSGNSQCSDVSFGSGKWRCIPVLLFAGTIPDLHSAN
jgi:DMSO/TMAO reductase YedYZ heme-binding membrane subunit